MNTGYLARIDPVALAHTVANLTAEGANVVRLDFDDEGEIIAAETTRREGLPPGEIDLRIRRRESLPAAFINA